MPNLSDICRLPEGKKCSKHKLCPVAQVSQDQIKMTICGSKFEMVLRAIVGSEMLKGFNDQAREDFNKKNIPAKVSESSYRRSILNTVDDPEVI